MKGLIAWLLSSPDEPYSMTFADRTREAKLEAALREIASIDYSFRAARIAKEALRS